MQQGQMLAGRFELVEKIDEGGMGEVWRGRQVALGREVAIKLIHSRQAGDMHELRERFQREAELAGRIDHRNVIDIIDFGTAEDGSLFLVMPFLRGESLSARLARQPPASLEEILRWTRSVLGGLAAIHDQGIVHRDLKPGNVFLAEDSDGVVPKLLDFGISREDTNEAAQGSALTRTGTPMGTPQYMAPEQFESARDADARADLFSLGAMLYEALTGRPPFAGTQPFAIYRAMLEGDAAPLTTLRPDLPIALQELVHRALARAPAERFSSAREMRQALDAIVVSGGVQGVSPAGVAGGGTPMHADMGTAPTLAAGGATGGAQPLAPVASPPPRAAAHPPAAPEVASSPTQSTLGVARSKTTWALLAAGLGGVVIVGGGLLAFLLLRPHPPTASGAAQSYGTASAPSATRDPERDLGSDAVAPTPPPSGAAVMPEVDAASAGDGLNLGSASSLGVLAVRWARLPAEARPDVRFVSRGAEWHIVAPSSAAPERVARLAAAGNATPTPASWDSNAGLTPHFVRTHVRLNVHEAPDMDSPTSRVLAHDTLFVALYGEHEGHVSTPDGEDAVTYVVAGTRSAGWARSHFLDTDRGCLPLPGALLRRAGGESTAAIRHDMATAHTRLMHDGVRHDAFMLVARDHDAARSYVGVFDAEAGCRVGDMIDFRRVDGVVDEPFLTDTDSAGGESLLVLGSYPRSRAPANGVLDWRVFQLGEARALWQMRVPTAAFLRRHERGSVSGSRDLALRNHEGYVLSIRQPRAERLWFTWSGGRFQEASAP